MSILKNILILVLAITAIIVWAHNVHLIFLLFNQTEEVITTTTTTTTTIKKKGFNITIVRECEKDSDCYLESVNCCPENAGAQWECINRKKSVIDCPLYVICPQFISPKPKGICICEDGRCVLR